MAGKRELEALLSNYLDFNVGQQQRNFLQDKTIKLVKRPVQRYSYALTRAALNVFVQHHFADPLNSLAFDRDGFAENVQQYVPYAWPYYLESAQESLTLAIIEPLRELTFTGWFPGGGNRFGAWHRMDFREFQMDVLLQVSNEKGRLGAFQGHCYLHNDENLGASRPPDSGTSCKELGSLHMQIITDEMLESLGISPESAISAIKWQMK
ncbi:MAG: hypothetical protein PVJ33_01060 [Lysobacterales bacterium]|jgi:hypothetical protein